MAKYVGYKRPKDTKKAIKHLLVYLGHYKWMFMLVALLVLISAGANVAGTYLVKPVVNHFIVPGDMEGLLKAVIAMGVMYACGALCTFGYNRIMVKVSQKVIQDLRNDLFAHVQKLPLKYFDAHTHGELMSRFTNDVDTLVQSLNQSLSTMVSSFVQIIGFLVMMLSISWKMTLMALIVIPLSLILVMVVVKKSQRYFKAQQKSLGLVYGFFEEMYSAHTIVKAFNGEEDSLRTFKEYNDQLYTSAWKSQFLSGLMMPLTNLIGNIGYVGVCILGGYITIHKEIAVGDIQSFITYTRNFTQPISQISQSMNMLQSTAAAAERVFEFLASEEEVAEVQNPVVFEDVQGQVTFENVCFGYDPSKIVINNFSMYIKPGQTTAIVGPTGAGKTTIVKLLMRFYELNAGAIYIDGHNITDYTRSDLRNMVGMVLQDAWLFE